MLAIRSIILSLLLASQLTHALVKLEGSKRRYLSKHGVHKVKKYLQKKYQQSHGKEKIKRHEKFFSNTWAVQLDPPKKSTADRIAKKHGFVNMGKVPVY